MIEIIVGIVVGLIVTEIIFWKFAETVDGTWREITLDKFFALLFGSMLGFSVSAITYVVGQLNINLFWPACIIGVVILFIIINIVLKYKIYHSKKCDKK